jgi:acyl-CoA thioesterase FadM
MIGWAESALLDCLGLLEGRDVRQINMPRVHVEADFRLPCRFRDLVAITVGVEDVGTTSVTYRADIQKAGQLCVEARVVAVLQDASGRPMGWPEEWRRLLSSGGPQAPQDTTTLL